MSRLSTASSSRVSMTSTDSENKEISADSLFPRRWEDEREMDKSLKILKRKQAATIRLRKMNCVADRILEGRVRDLNSHFTRLTRELRKETHFIQNEIKDIKPLKLPMIEPTVKSAPDSRSASSKSDSSNAPSRAVSRSSTTPPCNTCLFDPENTRWRCKHFPCCLPVTYHSIGFVETGNSYSVVGNYNQLLKRCRDLRPQTSTVRDSNADLAEEDTDAVSRAPRTTVKEKIRGLKQLVKEMKERNEKQKPRDWAVNYGDPIPRRIILKPVKT